MAPDPTASPTDQELVRNYLRGDPEAFDRLYDRHHRAVYWLVRQYFPQRERAEEIFQEIFMKILEKLDRYQAEGSFRAWAYTLSRNHCIDRLRYHARRKETPESALADRETSTPYLEQIAGGDPDQENRAYENELALHLQEALEKLPDEQRETFILKESGGMSFEEISRLTGVSVNTAKSRMRYALLQLRRTLRGKKFLKEAKS